jgi:Uma2 family endonuclease
VPSLSPDLAVEVVSETNTKVELAQKTREYFESGARLVWIVYPRPRTVAVFSQPSREPDH